MHMVSMRECRHGAVCEEGRTKKASSFPAPESAVGAASADSVRRMLPAGPDMKAAQ